MYYDEVSVCLSVMFYPHFLRCPPGPQLDCIELNDNLYIMMKCLSVRDFLSSLPALPSGVSFVMLFCAEVARGAHQDNEYGGDDDDNEVS